MKRLLAPGVLLAAGVLGGCVAAIVGGGGSGGQYAGQDQRSTARVAADNATTADVKARLNGEAGIRALPISVDTYDGVVTLKGDVRTSAQRATAEQLARGAKGVKSVRNELAVKG